AVLATGRDPLLSGLLLRGGLQLLRLLSGLLLRSGLLLGGLLLRSLLLSGLLLRSSLELLRLLGSSLLGSALLSRGLFGRRLGGALALVLLGALDLVDDGVALATLELGGDVTGLHRV